MEDIREIMERGVAVTLALVVDGEVVVSGRVPGVDELKEMLGWAQSYLTGESI